MQIENRTYLYEENGWTVRIQQPILSSLPADASRSLLLLHGWTGDEDVMWIFTRNIPRNYWIYSPRAPIPTTKGGYSWLPDNGEWPALAEFQEVAGQLMEAFQAWAAHFSAPAIHFDVMGFSQGAAMSYAMATFHSKHINRVLALAGFLPKSENSSKDYQPLSGKKVFIAHGSQDEIVAVSKAEEAARVLKAVGAEVTYCESNTGHKLSASCLRGVEEFFA